MNGRRGLRTRQVATAAGAGVGAIALSLVGMPQAFGLAANAGLLGTSGGQVSIVCDTPSPAAAETSPTATSGGVTVPTVPLPSVTVPTVSVPGQTIVQPVTIGQVTVGPFSIGPETINAITVGPESTPAVSTPPVTAGGGQVGGGSVGGQTIGNANAQDEIAAAGATACTAVNLTSPAQANMMSGTSHMRIQVEELNPATGALSFVTWRTTSAPLTDAPVACLPEIAMTDATDVKVAAFQTLCPNGIPIIGGDLAAGDQSQTFAGVPAAGTIDPNSGLVSAGIGVVYFGAAVVANGTAAPQGTGCDFGDYTCNTSETFPIE